jgi:integrase/recombinase XerD
VNTLALPAASIGNFGQMDPLHQAVIGFLARYQTKPSTFKDYTRDLQVFLDWSRDNGVHPLQAVSGQLEMYVAYLQRTGWAESTVSRSVMVMRGFFKRATRDRLITWDPAADIPIPKVDWRKQKRTHLGAVELAAFLKAATALGPLEHAVAQTLALTALRVGELTQLDVTSLRRDGGWEYVTFTGKGNKAAVLRLEPPVSEALHAYLGDRQMGPVFLNRAGNRMDRRQVAAVIRRICRAADLRTDITPHSLRRSAATALLDLGVAVSEVQALLRHESPTTTARYDQKAQQRGIIASSTIATHLTGLAS